MIDPVKFKKIIITILKILIVIEVLGALTEAFRGQGWSRLGFDLLVAGILYITWDRLRAIVRKKKEEYRRKVEESKENLKLWDALAFSLLWSDEIYRDIPRDRNRLIVISYTLIALGVLAAFLNIGSGLMPLVITGALVLGAVNLLAWVVATERGEKETLQTELKLAHDVQVSLMPKQQPAVDGFDISGVSIPAREVGGDHYEYSWIGQNHKRLGISVFDVSGKGMQAAMSAVFTSGAYASEARNCASAAAILSRLNKAVYTHSKRGHFVAFLLAVIDVSDRSLTFANAGQMKPLLKSSDGVVWLDSTGVTFPLGMTDNSQYEEKMVQLKRGDTLFLLSDGFTEAMNTQKELFGIERLERCVAGLDTAGLSSQQMIEEITAQVRSHVHTASQHDDMTMVVVKIL